jgi:hypothetical protein
MRAGRSGCESMKFGVWGASPSGEVQEAGGSLLPRGTGARSPRNSVAGARGA